jgi:biopolymer transport protein ExbD
VKQDEFTSIRQQTLKRLAAGRGQPFSLRMAPMIDIIFLLLVFFVLTAKFRVPEQFLTIQLPTPNEQVQRLDIVEPLIVSISPAGENQCRVSIGDSAHPVTVDIEIDNIARDLTTLAERVSDVLTARKRIPSDPVEIRCHDRVNWDYLVKIYNVLYAMGITDITFNMEF